MPPLSVSFTVKLSCSVNMTEDHKQPIAPVNGTSYWVSNFPARVNVTDVMPYISVSFTGKFSSCVNITDVMPYLSLSLSNCHVV